MAAAALCVVHGHGCLALGKHDQARPALVYHTLWVYHYWGIKAPVELAFADSPQ